MRPTCTSTAARTVTADSAGNLCAVAHRGARLSEPKRVCSATSFTLYTTPSTRYPSDARASPTDNRSCARITSSGVSPVANVGAGRRPHAATRRKNADWDDHASAVVSSTSPHEYTANRNGPASVPSPVGGSNRRSAPAAAFRAFLKRRRPAASLASLTASKSASERYTSPRTSKVLGTDPSSHDNRRGTPIAPASCCVTSSPVSPSPRETQRTRTPSSYRTEAEAPSIFGSAHSCTRASGRGVSRAEASGAAAEAAAEGGAYSPPSARRARATNAWTSSALKAFWRDCIGTAWRTGGRAAKAVLARSSEGTGAPTRRVGLSSRTRAGCARSMASKRTRRRSYSASETSGSASL